MLLRPQLQVCDDRNTTILFNFHPEPYLQKGPKCALDQRVLKAAHNTRFLHQKKTHSFGLVSHCWGEAMNTWLPSSALCFTFVFFS